MSLIEQVQAELGIGADGAARAVGTVFRAVRMTMKDERFNAVRDAFPQVEEWLKAAPVAGGRTAEMLAIVGPEALERSLKDLGLDAAQATRLFALVGSALAAAVPDVASDVKANLPMLG